MESDNRRHLDVSPTAKELEDLLDQSVMMIYPTAVDEVNCSGSLQAEKSLQGTQPSQDLVELRGVPLQGKPLLCVNGEFTSALNILLPVEKLLLYFPQIWSLSAMYDIYEVTS